jgi:hypothetical protein
MKERVNMTLDVDLIRELRKRADKEQRTISNLVNLMLRQIIEGEKSQDEKEN